MRITKRQVKLVCMAVFLLSLQGCILAPIFESVRKAGVTPASRKSLLPENVKKFHDALHWGNSTEALAYVESSHKEEIGAQLKDVSEDERIVESKVKSMDFDDGAFEATVEINIRSYRVPVYVVEDVRERQKWKYSMSDGWQIVSREVLKTNGRAKSKVG